MHPDRWKQVYPSLEEFQSYLAADAPRLQSHPVYDHSWSPDELNRRLGSRICKDYYGVYLMFDLESRLRYVGKALNKFEDRIWQHDGHVEYAWIDVVPFQHGWYFLAPALEFFLIVKLQPPDNTAYAKGYTIGDRAYRSLIPEI